MLNVRALHYLSEVVRKGSVRRAAAALGVDATAISRQLKALEDEVGLELCERTAAGMKATEAGELLVRHYQNQKTTEEAVLSRLDAIRGLHAGQVRIALGEGFIADLIAAPLQSFLARHPGIALDVQMAGVNEAVQLLKDYDTDVALLYAPPQDRDLVAHVETRHPLHLIVPPSHALAGSSRQLDLADIQDCRLALMGNQFGMGQLVGMVAQQERVELAPVLRTNSVAVLRQFVLSGTGAAFMPETTVQNDVKRGDLVVLPMRHPVFAQARAQIASRADRNLTVATQAFLDHLRRNMRFFREHAPDRHGVLV
ncbi:LysR family transcriptional regulator [Corticimicrobacter populi]|uniref:LysR family transcriptional regulator n=1 Tax=Corticimicrobacter populi TaxID=2175229 RepID=A0A2V1K2F6_9BURK|nr:LysR family transcriptional regulator [Corticimicrobacter populi]PWF24740.1 LysR family transcriptional regulator [Corticimicrobacter populi]